MYRQVGAALLLPQSLSAVLRQWRKISRALAEPSPAAPIQFRLG
jgi:hypothetical protein